MSPARSLQEKVTITFGGGKISVRGCIVLSTKKVITSLTALTLVIMAIAKFGPQVWPYVAPLLGQ